MLCNREHIAEKGNKRTIISVPESYSFILLQLK